jgi:hypothetical protein
MIRAFPTAACCLLFLSGLTTAQDGQMHEGFWISFGLGVGMNLTEGADRDSGIGGSGYFRVGGTLNQRVLLGGEAFGWTSQQHDDVITHGNVMFIAMLFPRYDSGGRRARYHGWRGFQCSSRSPTLFHTQHQLGPPADWRGEGLHVRKL